MKIICSWNVVSELQHTGRLNFLFGRVVASAYPLFALAWLHILNLFTSHLSPCFLQVGYHSEYDNSRCFVLVRKDGTVADFSYHKCVHNALRLIAPDWAKKYESKWLNGPKANSRVWPMGHRCRK